jgi:uncharacterized protein YndB with AHSA1/START domain
MNELTVTRFVAASPEKAWDVLANRQAEWFCPAPWRFEVNVQERRAGGRSASTMYGPDGEVHPSEGIFLAWDEGRRFVVTDALDASFWPQEPFMVGIWQVEPEEQGTRYTASARHWTTEAMEQHRAMGFEAGWGACADQFKALCESPSGSSYEAD